VEGAGVSVDTEPAGPGALREPTRVATVQAEPCTLNPSGGHLFRLPGVPPRRRVLGKDFAPEADHNRLLLLTQTREHQTAPLSVARCLENLPESVF